MTSATRRCSPREQAMAECLPYYTDLYDSMKAVGQTAPATA